MAIPRDPCPTASDPIKTSSKVWAKAEVLGLLPLSFVAVVFPAWGEEEEGSVLGHEGLYVVLWKMMTPCLFSSSQGSPAPCGDSPRAL